MDGILVLLGLIALAIPVCIIVLLIGQSNLKWRLAQLEKQVTSLTAARAVDPDRQTSLAAMPPAVVLAEKVPMPVQEAAPLRDEVPAAVGQDRPLVMRVDRFADLTRWLTQNWVYVISAVSLALAGIFLVQYSVQNGFLPPWLRVVAAIAFGGALIAAGEWLRRKSGDGEAATTAHLPSVFAGAGLVSIFGAVVAARQLYGLIGPEMALAGHVLTAAVAVVLGWFYGPLLVAIGIVGAAAAPFLVSSGAGAGPMLYGYYAMIAATGLAVDAIRRWAWVSVLALGLAYGCGYVMLQSGAGEAGWIVYVLALVALAVALPVMQVTPQHPGPGVIEAAWREGKAGWPIFPVRLAAGAALATTLALLMLPGETPLVGMLAYAGLVFLALYLLIWAEKAPGLADLAVLPALALPLRLYFEAMRYWPLAGDYMQQAITLRPPESAAPWTATLVLGMAVLVSLAAAYRALRPGAMALFYGLGAVLTAPVVAAMLELVWQPALVVGANIWALQIMALAGAMVVLALRFAALDGDDHRRLAYATLSALSLVALSIFVLTTDIGLTLALAALLVVAAGLDRRFRLPEMGLFIQVAVAALGYRLLVDPGIDWAFAGPMVQVIAAFGGAIVAQVAALRLIAGLERPVTKGVLDSAALGLAAVLANVLITRLILDGSADHGSLVETHFGAALNALPWLVMMLAQIYRAGLGGGLVRLRQVIAALAAVFAALPMFFACVIWNPLFSWGPEDWSGLVHGPLILDTLALAYAMPGLMLLGAQGRLRMHRLLHLAMIGIGALLLALYVALEIRRFWQGDWLGAPGVGQYELYTYTVALIALGAGLLYQSIARRSVFLRRIGMAVIAVTIAKVFLIDAAGLTGLTRVFSFLGLGLSLAGLAWLNRWAGQVSES